MFMWTVDIVGLKFISYFMITFRLVSSEANLPTTYTMWKTLEGGRDSTGMEHSSCPQEGPQTDGT